VRIEERKEALFQLGLAIKNDSDWIKDIVESAYIHNKWFTPANSAKALNAVADEFLNEEKLDHWLSPYQLVEANAKNVGLVLAGNIPLVGWHDILCTFITGNKSIIKYSSKDEILISQLIQRLELINPKTKDSFQKVEFIKDIDAVIATGGNTAATHFKQYFGKQPHIIRKNRSSVAVLTGKESDDELFSLMDDVFCYFGLGCRSVSKLFIPEDFNTDRIFEASLKYADVIDHPKYNNNFDYNNAIYLLGQRPFLTNNFLILVEDTALSSRISCLHYEKYTSVEVLASKLQQQHEDLQCISSNSSIGSIETIALGQCQMPSVSDYADGVDTIQFLINLSNDKK
jgi:hypothetical protein